MKQIIACTLCLVISGTSFAQKTAEKVKKANPNKSAIAGVIQNMRKQPIAGVRAFVYKKDSIAASGYSNDTGYFETNFVIPGIYNLKLVYPSEKTVLITAVPVKARTITMTNLKMPVPDGDTTISYAAIAPKVEKKEMPKKK
jgi:hypothetical protein